MKIGEKIKKLRSEKMMTQTELAGGVITRNMLSSIENGTALPSLATLRHISAKLNVPAGYLLADGEEEKIYLKFSQVSNIKNAYLSGNYRICRDMCANSELDKDDELNLIYAEATLALALEMFNDGALRSAGEYFDEAIDIASETVYNTEHISAIAAVYFRYMRNISATLASDVIDESDADVFAAMGSEFARYVIAFEALENGQRELSEKLMEGADREKPCFLHIKAKLDILDGRFDEAYNKLYLILTNPYKIQEPLMYFVFCDLELCCKELKDFKGAYEYSIDKIEVLQKMLRDS